MIQNDKLRSYLTAASVAFYSFACVSSQMASDPEHPASPGAPQAPLPPVGTALSEPAEPGPATNSPDVHSHEGGSAPGMTHNDPPSPNPHESHAAPSGSAPTPSTGSHTGHGSQALPTQTGEKGERWTCPMHPEVIQSE